MFLLSSAERVKETPEYTIVDGIVELSDRTVGWSSESTLQVVKLRGSGYLRGQATRSGSPGTGWSFIPADRGIARGTVPHGSRGGPQEDPQRPRAARRMFGGGLPERIDELW